MNKFLSVILCAVLVSQIPVYAQQKITEIQGDENFRENDVLFIESVDTPDGKILIGESDNSKFLGAGDYFHAGQPITWPEVENPSFCFTHNNKTYRIHKQQMSKYNKVFADLFRMCHLGNYSKGADSFITELQNIVKNEPHYMFDGRLRMQSTFKSDKLHYIAIPHSGQLLRIPHDTETYDLIFQKEKIENFLGIEIRDGSELTLQYCRPINEGPAIPIGILRIIIQ